MYCPDFPRCCSSPSPPEMLFKGNIKILSACLGLLRTLPLRSRAVDSPDAINSQQCPMHKWHKAHTKLEAFSRCWTYCACVHQMEKTFDKPSFSWVGWISRTLAALVAHTRLSTHRTFVQALYICTCDTTQISQPYCTCIKTTCAMENMKQK